MGAADGKKGVDPTKYMAELLKSGATMLAETCPVEGCHMPLFRLKSGEVVCPVHGRVYIVKTEEEAREIFERVGLASALSKVEELALRRLVELSGAEEADPLEIVKWLEVLERARKLKEGSRRASS